jgi:hypothetical protein
VTAVRGTTDQPTIELVTPASWRVVDLDPATSEQSAIRLVGETLGSEPGAAAARKLMLGLLRDVTTDAAEREAVLVALYSSTADGIPVGASLVASILQAMLGPEGELPSDGEAMADGMQVVVGAGMGERRDLPGGPALRLRRRQAALGDPGGRTAGGEEAWSLEVENVQWFVLHPSGRQLALLSFSTPNLALADAFGEVFDAIAWTLRWTA